MKRFLVDVELLPIIEKAEQGCGISQFQMASYYGLGRNGAPFDREWMRYFLYKLTKHYPKDIPMFYSDKSVVAYEELFRHLGVLAYNDGNYRESKKWYKRGIQYIKDN